MAKRLPTFIKSDHLTALALVSMFGAAAVFALLPAMSWAAPAFAGCMFLNWFGDSLDGTLARVRRQQRPRYGYYVDHVIDLAGTAALMIGMSVSGLITPVLAFALLATYLLVAAESFLGTHARGVFRMAFAGIGPTELRVILVVGAVKVAVAPTVTLAGRDMLLLDVGAIVAIAGLASAFVIASVRNSIALHRAEPLPRTDVVESSCALS
jgi:phosphatidylglycerophosphate synthase